MRGFGDRKDAVLDRDVIGAAALAGQLELEDGLEAPGGVFLKARAQSFEVLFGAGDRFRHVAPPGLVGPASETCSTLSRRFCQAFSTVRKEIETCSSFLLGSGRFRLTGGDTMSMWRIPEFLLVLTLLSGGCGGGGNGTPPPPPDAGADGCVVISAPEQTAAPASGNVVGTWGGLQLALAQVNNIRTEQLSRNLYLYEQKTGAGPGQLDVTETTCGLIVDDINGLSKSRFLPSFVASIPQQTRTA